MLWPVTTQRNDAGEMTIGGVSLPAIADEFGTPVYIYDEETLRTRARAMRDAFAQAYPNARLVYASKAYAAPAIIRIFRDEGLGLDIVSGGELHAGLRAGMPTALMTFHGNNKSSEELEAAISAGVGHIAIDNVHELELVAEIGKQRSSAVPVLLRLNPGIDVHTHAKIATGVNDSKFGFPVWDGSAERAVAGAMAAPGLRLEGYHLHIGSQLLDWEGYRLAIETALGFAGEMKRAHGVEPAIFSPGGGFGIAYTEEMQEPDLKDWAAAASEAVRVACEANDLPLPELIIEPGRTLVGPAGVALYTIGSRKEIEGVRTYVSIDGGMADNIRPALYEARYTAEIANRAHTGEPERVTIAGKYCESGDLLIKDIDLPMLAAGDLLAVPGSGAYCLAMASNYNLARRPAVVMVRDGAARLIRRRETYADLLAHDLLPD